MTACIECKHRKWTDNGIVESNSPHCIVNNGVKEEFDAQNGILIRTPILIQCRLKNKGDCKDFAPLEEPIKWYQRLYEWLDA